MNPRKDCEVTLDDHSQLRRIQRGLPFVDLEKMVRTGRWQAKQQKKYDVRYKGWTIRVLVGQCILSVLTLMPKR